VTCIVIVSLKSSSTMVFARSVVFAVLTCFIVVAYGDGVYDNNISPYRSVLDTYTRERSSTVKRHFSRSEE
jgi:hypothetical protein